MLQHQFWKKKRLFSRNILQRHSAKWFILCWKSLACLGIIYQVCLQQRSLSKLGMHEKCPSYDKNNSNHESKWIETLDLAIGWSKGNTDGELERGSKYCLILSFSGLFTATEKSTRITVLLASCFNPNENPKYEVCNGRQFSTHLLHFSVRLWLPLI